jgi:hypothetical protein
VRPAPALALSGSLRQVGSESEQRGVAGIGASVNLLRRVEVSGTYRRPTGEDPANPDLYGSDLRVSLAPIRGFRVFGQYSLRPEDERGALTDETHRSLGLETTLGSLSLQGSVTELQGVTLTDPGQRTDFLATLSLGKRTRLFGGVRLQERPTLEAGQSRIYRAGITQTAGESLFILLEGQLGWVVDPTGAQALNPDDARAQARLGLRF